MRAACEPEEEFRRMNYIRNHEIDPLGRADLLIVIGMGEHGKPHFHVFRSEEDLYAWRNGTAILFHENSYYRHGSHNEVLTEEEFNAIINCMKETKTIDVIESNNWCYMIHLWNVSNKNLQVEESSEIFNYDYKTLQAEDQPIVKTDNKKAPWERS